MGSGSTVETVETDAKPVPFQLGTIFLSGFVALVAALILRSMLGAAGPLQIAGLGVAIFFLLEVLLYLTSRAGPVEFYRDHVEFDGETVDYDDVSTAVRSQSLAQRLFGTAHYELVAHGARNLTLRNVTDTDGAEQVLSEQLPDPAKQVDERDQSHRRQPRFLTNRSAFWYYWEAEDGTLPEDPVVDAAQLGDVLDVSVSSADLDELDDVDMDSASGLGDIDAGDVGADSGGDGGGGGFDGGGGGGGGE